MDSDFRLLSTRERGLIEKLLEADFTGSDELRAQLSSVTGKQIEEDGTLSLRCSAGPPAPTKYRLAAEGTCKDADGALISVLLHVDNEGFMTMLEIIRYDGSPLINSPSADELTALLP
jgi:hypothetical protein